jgi:hypothetical protein
MIYVNQSTDNTTNLLFVAGYQSDGVKELYADFLDIAGVVELDMDEAGLREDMNEFIKAVFSGA